MYSEVCFGSYSSFQDWGMILTDLVIGEAKPIKKFISIPGRRVPLDATEIYGGIFYENREIEFHFEKKTGPGEYLALLAQIGNAIHGKRLSASQSVRPSWYWLGRLSVTGSYDKNLQLAKISVSMDAEPYQYRDAVGDEWEWDPFFFDEDIIQPALTSLAVSGSLTLSLITVAEARLSVRASSSGMAISFEEHSYPLTAGQSVRIGRMLPAGINSVTITGTGTVTIEMREESL